MIAPERDSGSQRVVLSFARLHRAGWGLHTRAALPRT